MGNFAGAAEAYDKFRPAAAQELVDYILAAVDKPVTLLDLGTGTGRITAQFAPHFQETICIEPERDMVKIARERLRHLPVTVRHETAEAMQLPEGWHASLVTIARAFHWMDRPVVLRRLRQIMVPGGHLAVFTDNSFWESEEPWAEVVRRVIKKYTGADRKTVTGTFHRPAAPFEADMEASGFTNLDRKHFPVTREWTLDQILGYLQSTSFASRALLGDHADAFESDLRHELEQLSPNGLFTEKNNFTLLLARFDPEG